jgi:hypothetical protein
MTGSDSKDVPQCCSAEIGSIKLLISSEEIGDGVDGVDGVVEGDSVIVLDKSAGEMGREELIKLNVMVDNFRH